MALVETDIPTCLELGKGDKIMNEYINELIEVTDDESFGESYDKELAWREQMKHDAIREGFQQGREQGITQLVKYMSSQYDTDSIAKITGLSKEEVEKYLKNNE